MRRILTLCLVATLCLAAASDAQRVKTGELRADLDRDPRLSQPISISRYRIHLGKLLEQISKDTGVSLETDERSQALSGYELALVSHQRPTWELLDALPRLYSQGPDRWRWSKSMRNGAACYTLHNTLSSAALQRLRDSQAVAYLLGDLRRKRAFYALPPAQRAMTALTDPALKAIDNPKAEMGFSFVSGLSEAQLRQILQGETLQVPAERFTPLQRRFLVDQFEQINARERNDPMVLEGKREAIEHRADQVAEASISTTGPFRDLPNVSVKLGPTSVSLLGGFDWLRVMREQPVVGWRAADESAVAPDQPVPIPGRPLRADEQPVQGDAPDRVLERLGQMGRLNLVYDRPVLRTWNFYRIYRAKLTGQLPEVLRSLEGQNLIWKRKDPFLEFRLVDWLANRRDVLLPWPKLKELRENQRANNGYLTVDGLIELIALRPEQQEYLRSDFPDLTALPREPELVSLLRFAGALDAPQRAKLADPAGSGWADWSDPARKHAETVFGAERARTARLFLRTTTAGQRQPQIVYGVSADGTPPRLATRALLRCREDPGTLYPTTAPAPPGS